MTDETSRRDLMKLACAAAGAAALPGSEAPAADATTKKNDTPPELPPTVVRYLERLYDEKRRAHAFRADYPGGFHRWQSDARPALRRLVGLDTIAASVGRHRPKVELEPIQEKGDYTIRKGQLQTEPDVTIPFWLLKPPGKGPFPLAVLPHGHNRRGYDVYAGVYPTDADRRRALAEDRDVAVQAVKQGFLAVAPATRGIGADGVPDVWQRHGGRDCRSQLMHCLLADRTPTGERVWDMQKIIDWATTRPDVDAKHILIMGNSGGGMVTLYAAACDERVTIAVPSCSFCTFVSDGGRIYHCDCNMVPGILRSFDLSDVAGLIALRRLLIVNGRTDALFAPQDVTRAANHVRAIYDAAGCPSHFEHRWGHAGHRFYKDLMWPFILESLKG
ncbi:MAG: acetylxylan esterase [Phycisphaerae bacterium]|nr:acetylxylan esterase [Phycisphaerae bacterium]